MSKYEPLTRHLNSLTVDRWTASFSEIEKILGFTLPASARQYNAWWANQAGGGHSQSNSWQSAGWQTAEPNFVAETVKFTRARPRLAHASSTTSADVATERAESDATNPPLQLTIEEAKMGLSAFYRIPVERIEIIMRG